MKLGECAKSLLDFIMALFQFNKNSVTTTHLSHVICEYCDLMLDDIEVPSRHDLVCPRCKSVLFFNRADSLEREYALVLTGLLLFLPAIFLPIMNISPFGRNIDVSMMDGVVIFIKQHDPLVALIVFGGAIAAPFLNLFLLFLVISIVYLNRMEKVRQYFSTSDHSAEEIRKGLHDYGVLFFRWYKLVNPWLMLEVYLIGFLITFSNVDKMESTAHAVPGLGFYAFLGLMLVTILSSLTLNSQFVWQCLDKR